MSLLQALRKVPLERPGDPAFLFLANGEDEAEAWSFGELDRRARAIAALLEPLGPGSRVLLLFPPGLDFLAGFLGCLYAGCVAVPAYPPQSSRGLPRLQRIVEDARPGAILISSAFRHRLRSAALDLPALGAIPCWAVDETDPALAADWREPDLAAEDLALLQYTSGSTSLPKGVMVSHGNLLHNGEMVRQAFRQSAASVVVSWLPPYHDMGLIGGLLQPLYVGARCVLMSPMAFLQKPLRWLRAVSRYRGTTSGGPNFAYDLCVRRIGEAERADLDLSSWAVAFNGAEPVRADTLERFAGAFSPCGFRKASFYPCYGLAEATLFVAGGSAGSLPRETAVDAAELAQNRVVELPAGHPGARSLVGCGHPWNGQRIAVVDPESGLECPPGRVGEIRVEGPSVACGYWGASAPAELAAGLAAPSVDGPRGLRTGDLGFLSGGELFITGRLKELIIVRGRNHYPQDLELTAERSHPALRPGGGAAFSIEVAGDERVVLVHEVARHAAGAPGEAAEAVRRAVAEEHEMQVHEVVLIAAGTLPKTSSGKNQRGVCRDLYLQGRLEVVERTGGSGENAPEPDAVADGRLAELLPALRDEVSRHTGAAAEGVGLEEPLTRLGLDSLAAVELQASLERRWGVTVPLASLLAGADLLEIGRALLAGGEGEAAADRVEPGSSRVGDSSPLSYGQKALWVLHRLAGHSGAYHIAAAARAIPALDGEVLLRALGALVRRHAALRATFQEVEGVPVQRFEGPEPELHEVEASGWSEEELERRLLAEAQRPFDLASGPLLRMVLLRRSPAEDRLLLVTHHIVADFWSLALLARELSALYAAASEDGEAALPRPAVSYADYVRWEQRRMAGCDGERLWEYWRERLSGPLPELDLPADRLRPPVQSYAGGSVARDLGPALSLQIPALARARGVTLSSLLLAAYAVLLHRYSRQRDLLVGVPTAGRRRPELADLIGYFVNPVVVRADLSGAPGFAPFLARVHAAALAAIEHGDYPFALLVERLQPERDPSRSPLFETMFLLEGARRFEEPALAAFALRAGGARLRLGRHTLESVAWPERTSQLDLTLRMGEVSGSLIGSLQYNSDLLDGATAERMLGHFEALLAAAVLDPERSIAELPLLTRGERDQMLRQGSVTQVDRPAGACLHELFAAQAARRPEALAIVDGERRWTYGDLNLRANRIAHRLRGLGLGPERIAGVLMGRSAETVAALLGVLKAGAAYLFLDPGYPAGRLSLIVEDAGLAALLTEERSAGRLPLAGVPEVRVDAGDEAVAGGSDEDPEPWASPDNLAYVIYTSGSTGRPKGVGVTHRGPVERMRWAREAFPPELLAGVLGATSFGFDVSVFELFAALSWGGAVILAGSVLELAGLPAASEVTLVSTVPSAMAELARALPPSVRAVVLAGEALTPPVVERVYGRPGVERVDNVYGPTEDSIYSTFATLGRAAGRVTIGRPLANTRAYVVDRRGEPVPAGVPGELCLAGAGTARGYLGRPDLTAERFTPDPFASNAGGRLYRTGDLVRWLPGGELEFLGRLDDQVKVRGFRIEPGEIEAALLEHPGVEEVAVVLRAIGAGGPALAAYVAPATVGAAELALHLQDRLPRYMVPAAFHLLPALPRTASGKVDRRALLARAAADSGPEERHVPPRTPAEERIAAIWAEALDLPRVGGTDDFFRLGGHSLLALRVAWRLQDAFGIAVPLQEILQNPTPAQLAARLETLPQVPAAGDLEIRSRSDRDSWPLSAGQRQLWFLDHLEPGSSAYVMPVALQLRGALDGAALAAACDEIRRRHEPLRTVFPARGGEPTQRVSPFVSCPLPFVDLTGLPRLEAAAEVSRVTRREALRAFDLAAGPLLRIAVFRLAAEDHWMLVALHHIVGDGRSAEIFFRELGALYESFSHGRPSPLPELPIQYCDFAAWQSEQLARGAFAPQLAYWRERLADSPESLELPADRARPAAAGRPAGRAVRLFAPWLWDRLQQLGRRHRATPFMVLLAAFQTQLSRYTGERDVVVGTPVAGRDRRETEDLIGFLVNTLALRTDLSGDPTFLELLARVRAAAVADFAHQELPFARLVEELRPGRHSQQTPLFQVMLSIAGPLQVGIHGLAVLPVEIAAAEAKLDLLLAVEPAEGSLSMVLEYDAGRFDAATGHRLLASYETLLGSTVREPERRLSDLDLLEPAELRQLLAWGEGGRVAERAVWAHEAFAGWAARSPEQLAMELGEERWSYGELEAWSNRLASDLVSQGAGPERVVGLCVERSAEMVAGVLGILKSGAAYLPLDPENPAERLRLLVADAGAGWVLTSADLAERFAGSGARLVRFDGDAARLAAEPAQAPRVELTAESLAYVLYTSGSTGRPKGVAVSHGSLANFLGWAAGELLATSARRLPVVTRLSFDANLLQWLAPLARGGSVWLVAAEELRDVAALSRLLVGGAEVGFNCVPSLWSAVLAELEQGRTRADFGHLYLGGEGFSRELVARTAAALPGVTIWNLYGPTEATSNATCGRVDGLGAGPITLGGAIPGARVYLLDAELRPVPWGAVGDLCIGGAGLARGYLGRPGATAEAFVPDPWSGGAGERLFRTGDLGRYRAAGELEVLGRRDHQVKIRGFRIELGEIESALLAFPEVAEAVVTTSPGSAGDRRLVAYVAPRPEGAAATGEALRAHLSARLPAYMVPSAFVLLGSLPKTPSGKVDRRALAPPRLDAASEVRGSRNPVEELLTGIWAEVLGLQRVGVEESFFDLGGHSLLATQAVARVQALGWSVTVRDLFEAPTIAALAGRIAATLLGSEEPAAPPLRRILRSAGLPLSSAQERLWFLDQLDPGSAAYNIPTAVRLTGPLRLPALAAALAGIAARHEVLRTRFEPRGGRPVQILSPEPRLPLGLIDLAALPQGLRAREIERLVTEEALRPFDLACGPLLRAAVVREDESRHVALFTMHHIVSDGWSMGVLVRELGALYRAALTGGPPALPELPFQYADYAAWQRENLADRAERDLAYWRQALSGVPPLELPTDRPRPREIGTQGGGHAFRLPAGLSGRLAELAREEGVTPFMILLAGLTAQLSRYTGQEDVAVGSPVANRTRAETEGLIGFFVNTLVLRTSCVGDPSHRELLVRVREVCLGAFAHQDVPFDRVVDELAPERDPGRTPLFQVVFAIQPASWQALELAGLEWQSLPLEERTAKFDLTVTLAEGAAGMTGSWGYNRNLFEAATAARMAGHFEVLLSALAAHPGGRLSEVPLLRQAEREQVLVEWAGQASPYPRERTLDELFAAAVARCPDAVALAWEDGRMTYGELDRRSDLLAGRLVALGIGPDVPVGILLRRSAELIIATVGVLKAGGAYLPLDPSYPRQRLGLMLREARSPVVVTDESSAPALPDDHGLTLLLVARYGEAAAGFTPRRPEPENLAYVMYTSGSTGVPKGVAVTHRAVVRLVLGNDYARFAADEVFLQLAPYAFDAATFEIWGALLHGARLVLAPPEALAPEELEEVLARHGVTTLWLTAGLFHQVVELRPQALRPLRQLLAGGDVLSPGHVRRALVESPGLRLINGYGPTESTTFTCCHSMSDARQVGDAVPLGRPIANTRAYVLDRGLQPAPLGVPGELFLGGDGLARGYLARPDLTAERFVPSPYGAPGERLYRTGDLVRWRPRGELDFLGRFDSQVKIRGYRIEPGEVEAVLARHEGVAAAVVVAREEEPGDRRLAAYLVSRPGVELDAGAVRAFLRERLPEHLIPASISAVAALPLTPQGKVDRRALASLEPAAPLRRSGPARDPVTELLCGAWAEVLGLERVGEEEDFFELGGHSLLATRLVSRVRELFGVELPVRALFEAPTPAGLAARLEPGLRGGEEVDFLPPLRPQPRGGELPLSFAQERLWLLSQLAPESAFYNLPAAVRLGGGLDAVALGRAFGEIERRHESLRTTFVVHGGRPAQLVAEPAAWVLAEIDLSSLGSRGEGEALRLAGEAAARPFDLARDRPLRASLLRLGVDDHVLLVTLHHIAADAWSVDVFCRELNALYGAFAAGQGSPLAEPPIQYGDFALWQRSWLRGERLERLLGYWAERLAGAARLQLPADRARPVRSSHRGRSTSVQLSPELSEWLLGLARRAGVTLYMLLLSALALLLSRYGGEEDVPVGSPIANRTRLEVEGLIGFFVNLLVLRCAVSGEATFETLLSWVREISLEAYAHQDLPFERLVEELGGGSHPPLVEVTFSVQNAAAVSLELSGLSSRSLDLELTTARFDLAVDAWERPEGMELHWTYSTEIFDDSTIGRMAGHFTTLLAGLAAGCERPVSELPLLGENELRQLLAWGEGGRVAERAAWAHEAFAGWAARSPERLAMELGEARWSYGELEAWSNRLASDLVSQGAGPERVVGLCVERSAEMVAGVLGILKSGAAYLPLDPENPAERLRSLVADAGAGWVLTSAELAERFAGSGARLVRFDGAAARLAAEPAPAPRVELTAESLAYVLYTSGSTGRPKGVAVSHGSLANFLGWAGELLSASARRLPLVTRLSFDANLLQWLAPLARGGSVWLVAPEALRDVAALSRLLVGGAEVGFNCVPSLWSAVLGEVEQGRTRADFGHLYLGGEGFSRELVARTAAALPGVTIWNLYGPTEATSNATCGRVDVSGEGPITLGGAIPGARVYLLDAELRPVPWGAVGELCIGGAGLARGYLGRPGATAAAFVPDPWSGGAGERLFRTGDLGRYRGAGELEVLGRRDHQVKIRGFRIELGEIESALLAFPGVAEAVVVARGESTGDRHLAAYVMLLPETAANLAAEAAGERVATWQERFDDFYDQAVWMEGPEADYAGWSDRYTGQPFAAGEMEEWTAVTVERIAALRPERVLEIGCGTGLLLFRLAPGCRLYRASDLSRNAVLFLRERLAQLDPPLPQVALHQAAADDFASHGPERFDTVILNSVVQYFPTVDYLLAVLAGAVARVSPGGAVFVGDVRSLPLLETLHLSVQLHRAADGLPLEELRQRVRREVEQDEELALDPAFFHALRGRLPEITAVEVRPRRGRRRTEMAVFRYDVVLRVGGVSAPQAPAEPTALDWRREGLSLAALHRLLATEAPPALALTGVPNARLRREAAALALLRGRRLAGATAGELRRAVDRRLAEGVSEPGVDPEEIPAALRDLPYDVDLSWESGDPAGSFTLLLTRLGSARLRLPSPAGDGRPWGAYANQPLRGRIVQRLVPELRASLRASLPDSMVPSAFAMLDALPRNSNGKVDRRALPAPATRETSGGYVAPRTPTEQILAEIWKDLLELERVGVHDNFFDIGGHSLLVTQVVSRVREQFLVDLPLAAVFETSTIAELAVVLVQRQAEQMDPETLAALLAEIGDAGPEAGEMLGANRLGEGEPS